MRIKIPPFKQGGQKNRRDDLITQKKGANVNVGQMRHSIIQKTTKTDYSANLVIVRVLREYSGVLSASSS